MHGGSPQPGHYIASMAGNAAKDWQPGAMAFLTLIVVVACAAGGWVLFDRHFSAQASANVVASGEPVAVELGGDYYVHVKLIELTPKRHGGGKWEPRGASAPDVRFALYWNGTRIFTSVERPDRLIADWDLLRLDLKDALLSGQVEVASAINAPIVRAEAGGVLTIEIWDEDVSFDDEAAKFDLSVDLLREGLNTLTPGEGGVARVLLDMVPRDTPLPELLDRASNR